MNTIIADNLRTEQTVSTRIDLFFKQIGLSKLLKKSNFYKESGIPCTEILKTLFTLAFADKNPYRMLDTNPEQIGFKKMTETEARRLSCWPECLTTPCTNT